MKRPKQVARIKKGGNRMSRLKGLCLSAIIILSFLVVPYVAQAYDLGDILGLMSSAISSGNITSVYEYQNGFMTGVGDLATGTMTHLPNGEVSEITQLSLDYDVDGMIQWLKDNGLWEQFCDEMGYDPATGLSTDPDNQGQPVQVSHIVAFLGNSDEEGGDPRASEAEIEALLDANSEVVSTTITRVYGENGVLAAQVTPVFDQNGNIVDGLANTTTYENGSISQIDGYVWQADDPTTSADESGWIAANLTYNWETYSATGNLALAPGLQQNMLNDGEVLNAEGTIYFDNQGRMKEFGLLVDGTYSKRASFEYDPQGRLTNVALYDRNQELRGALSYEYKGPYTVSVTEWANFEPGGTDMEIVSTTTYEYGRYNALETTTTIWDGVESADDFASFEEAMKASAYYGAVFGSIADADGDGSNQDEINAALHELYDALVSGKLKIGGTVTIAGIEFQMVAETGENSVARLDARVGGTRYQMRHIPKALYDNLGKGHSGGSVIQTTYFLFGKPIFSATTNVGGGGTIDWGDMWGDPAATGTVYIADDGSVHMLVDVYTYINEDGEQVTVQLEEGEEIDIVLDLSLLNDDEKSAILNAAATGQAIVLHGGTNTGSIYEGAILTVFGLGAGEFDKHPLLD